MAADKMLQMTPDDVLNADQVKDRGHCRTSRANTREIELLAKRTSRTIAFLALCDTGRTVSLDLRGVEVEIDPMRLKSSEIKVASVVAPPGAET